MERQYGKDQTSPGSTAQEGTGGAPGCFRATVVLLMLMAAAGRGWALSPNEVLVVANVRSEESVALAEFYATQRGIGEQNICLIDTSTAHKINRDKYEVEIRRPVGQHIIDKKVTGKIRCICLMWGVPVRVVGELSGGNSGMTNIYKRALSKAHYRLATGRKLLGRVGREFPTPQTEGLTPVAKLFKQPVRGPSLPLMALDELRKDINRLLAKRQVETETLRDEEKKKISTRQIMGLYLDMKGLRGLISYLRIAGDVGQGMDAEKLRVQLTDLNRRLDALRGASATGENVQARLDLIEKIGGPWSVAHYAAKQIKRAKPADASVDSALSLLWWGAEYPASDWQPNLLHWKATPPSKRIPPILMTARIDGPSAQDARRIIVDSLAVEKTGLDGVFYIDAGGAAKLGKPGTRDGYTVYDRTLRRLNSFLTSNTKLKVVIDNKPEVFPPGACPDAALYVGWYSLQEYVPAFTWVRGAVGWHTASLEVTKLRDPNSTEWCARMIRNGVTATLGAVSEPTLAAFPPAEEFFPLLLTGKYTVAECYWRTQKFTSWRMTLIADPLYNPFAANPKLARESLRSGLAP